MDAQWPILLIGAAILAPIVVRVVTRVIAAFRALPDAETPMDLVLALLDLVQMGCFIAVVVLTLSTHVSPTVFYALVAGFALPMIVRMAMASRQ